VEKHLFMIMLFLPCSMEEDLSCLVIYDHEPSGAIFLLIICKNKNIDISLMSVYFIHFIHSNFDCLEHVI